MISATSHRLATQRRFAVAVSAAAVATYGLSIPLLSPSTQASTCPSGSTAVSGTSPLVCEVQFTSSGTWTVPTGVAAVDALLVGGGGGGSGAYAFQSDFGGGAVTPMRTIGGNGGGGGYVRIVTGQSVGSSETATIGTGGSGGAGCFDDETSGGSGVCASTGGLQSTSGNNGGLTAFAGLQSAGGIGGSPAFRGCRDSASPPTLGVGGKSGLQVASGSASEFNGGLAANNVGNKICPGGGGAGANGTGGDASNSVGGNGGAGISSSASWGLLASLSGTYSGGGAGGGANNGAAGTSPSTLKGGGGAGGDSSGYTNAGAGSAGTDGIVIVRFYSPPVITTINPSTGIEAGDTLTVSGSNLSVGSVQVTVSGTSVTPTSSSSTQIVFAAPTLSPGSQTLLIETLNSSSTVVGSLSQTITYASPTPPAPPAPNPGPNPGPAPAPAGPTDPTTPSNGGGSTGGGGASNATSTPASLPPASSANGAVVLVGGQQVEVTSTPLSDSAAGSGGGASSAASLPPRLQRQLPPANGSQLVVGDSTLTVKGPQLGGSREGSALAIAPGAPVDLALSGFQAGTEVGIYVINEDGTFVLIGTAVVDPDGTIRSAVTVPAGAVTGTGRLQIQGTNASGAALTVGLDAQILPPVAPVPRATGALPEVKPGRVSVINAEGEAVRSSVDRVNGTDIRIRAQNSTSNIQAVDSDGVRPLGSQGAIEVEEEGFVRLGGSGFQPNSTVEVWMFSDPTFVGVVQTDAEGNYDSLLQMPDALQPGEHTLQSAGTARNGTEIAASAGLRVTEAEKSSGSTAGAPSSSGGQRKLSDTVYFDRMSSHLDAADKKKLDRIATKVGDRPTRVNITGYVQASSDTFNDKSLSTARARAVAKYLRSKGVRGTFTVRGMGVLDGPSSKARSARVEIRVR